MTLKDRQNKASIDPFECARRSFDLGGATWHVSQVVGVMQQPSAVVIVPFLASVAAPSAAGSASSCSTHPGAGVRWDGCRLLSSVQIESGPPYCARRPTVVGPAAQPRARATNQPEAYSRPATIPAR
jgi:hypothetical protein